MSLLDSLFGVQQVFRSGVEFVRRKAFDFVGPGWTIADNPTTGRTELAINATELAEDEALLQAIQDATFHRGSSNVEWTEAARKIVVRAGGSGSSAGLYLETAGGSTRLLFGYDANALRSRIQAAVSPADLVGNWSVPSGSFFSVPTPTASGHAATKGYVDALAGVPWTPTVTGTQHTGNGNGVVGWHVRLGDLVLFGLGFTAEDSSASAPKRFTVTLPIARTGAFLNRRQAWGSGSGGINNATSDPTHIGVKSVTGEQLIQIDNMSTANGVEQYNVVGAYSLTD